ncbi:MAG: YeeE/YedE family protein [Bauldia sp.]|nr:YeeE/YedE family protein [Bauldia sp.]MCW5717181.1 YeeE/YedE family protein [Bauldia sp.]
MTAFTPLSATIGGVLIGLSAGLLWLLNGRTAGISGIFGGLLPHRSRDAVWRLVFLAALPVGAIVGTWLGPKIFSEIAGGTPALGLAPIVAVGAGLLVGVGTRLGGGCTSGHGICGLARFSARSLVAVVTFMLVAMATVFVVRHVL